MRLLIFIFLLSGCTNGQIEIHVFPKYEGPVIIVEDYSNPEAVEREVSIDSIGIMKIFMSSDKTELKILDEKNLFIRRYDIS
ncbi:hypothetical protein [Fluviicola sp.]|uniref:hypothetical protein n=1 Tax=Fluviicola sp. TaxID=1917219 RepID=UPI0031DAA9DC